VRLAPLIACAFVLLGPPAAAQAPPRPPRIGQLAELAFDAGSTHLSAKDRLASQLGAVATWSQTHHDGLVVLDGHSDSSGSPARNLKLSLLRAQAVRDELVALGVDPDVIVIAAYGDAVPSGRGAAADRRVVVWGTCAGMRAVVARTTVPGHAVVWTGVMTPLAPPSKPGAVAAR
jgi:OOP family OmpA-OmpF porin